MNKIGGEDTSMPQESQERLREMVASLSHEQQKAVEAFIHYLQQKDSQPSNADLHTVLDEFVRDHSELLRRLAQ
jgi:hypothetical protein